MRQWRCGLRSKLTLCVALGAGIAILLSLAMTLPGSSWTTTSTSSILLSMAKPCGDEVPQLRLLNCAPGCERHGVCDREFGTCK